MLTLLILVALVTVGAVAATIVNRSRPVSQLGPVGEWRERRRAARGGPDGPLQAIHRLRALKARGGVMRDALAKAYKALKHQSRASAKAQRLMAAAAHARDRFERSRENEHTELERIRKVAPGALGHHSGLLAKLAALALFLGGCLLNANTYADFEPSHADLVTSALQEIGVSSAWLLGAFQMFGFTLLGSAIAGCIVYALAPTVAMYTGNREDKQRIVYGHFSPLVFAILAALFFAFTLAVAYAVARLRLYGSLLDTAGGASAPGTSAAGSLGGGAAPAATPPGQLWTFMILALLELVATIAVFVFLEPAVTRKVRSLRKQTDKDERRHQRLVRRADRARTAAAGFGLDANRHRHSATVRAWQADLDARELDSIAGIELNPDDAAEHVPDGVLPEPGDVPAPRTTPEPYPDVPPAEAPATRILNDAGHHARDYRAEAAPSSNNHTNPAAR